MKKILTLFLIALNFNSCITLDNQLKTKTLQDTNCLYPSPKITIPFHDNWTKKHYIEKIAEFKANPLQFGDIVFIGNSITEKGENWGKRFNNSRVKNRGIAGDVTAGILNRLAEIYYYTPKKVFLKIGINDLFHNELTPELVANNIKMIVEKIHLESPSTKIFVHTILPTSKNTILKEKIIATNKIIKNSVATDFCEIIDLYRLFADENEMMISSYTIDGIHLSEAGYIVWQNCNKEFVND